MVMKDTALFGRNLVPKNQSKIMEVKRLLRDLVDVGSVTAALNHFYKNLRIYFFLFMRHSLKT